MFSQEIIEKVKEIAIPCLKDRGFELVEVKYHGRNRPVLTLLIDRLDGGITIEECALMNNLISRALDAAEMFGAGYVLEMSSPGVDRPLKQKNDFCRVIGRTVKCFFAEPIEGRQELEGSVKAADEGRVTLETAAGSIDIPYGKINKARQVI